MKIKLIYLLSAALLFCSVTTKAAPLSTDSTPLFDAGSNESSDVEVIGTNYIFDLTDSKKTYAGNLSMEYQLYNPTDNNIVWRLSVPVISRFDKVDKDLIQVEDGYNEIFVEPRFSKILSDKQNTSSHKRSSTADDLFDLPNTTIMANEEGTLYKIQVPPNIADSDTIQALSITPISDKCQIYHIDHAAYTNKQSGYDFELKLNDSTQYAYIYVSGKLGVDYSVSYQNADKLIIDTMEIGVKDFIEIGIQWYLEDIKPSDLSLELDLLPYINQILIENIDKKDPINLLDMIQSVFESYVIGMYEFNVTLEPGQEKTLKISYPVESDTGKFQYIPYSVQSGIPVKNLSWQFHTPSKYYQMTSSDGIVEKNPYIINFQDPPINTVDITLLRGFPSQKIGFYLVCFGFLLLIIFPVSLLIKRRKRK